MIKFAFSLSNFRFCFLPETCQHMPKRPFSNGILNGIFIEHLLLDLLFGYILLHNFQWISLYDCATTEDLCDCYRRIRRQTPYVCRVQYCRVRSCHKTLVISIHWRQNQYFHSIKPGSRYGSIYWDQQVELTASRQLASSSGRKTSPRLFGKTPTRPFQSAKLCLLCRVFV